jgi:hypothetical protein
LFRARQRACEQQRCILSQPFAQTQAFQHSFCERMEQFLPERCIFAAVNLSSRLLFPFLVSEQIRLITDYLETLLARCDPF